MSGENWNPNTATPDCDWCGECEWCDNLHPTPEPSEVAETTAGERECRYPCGCDQFPDEHCACMDGHTPAEPDAGVVLAAFALAEEIWQDEPTEAEQLLMQCVLTSDWLAACVSAAETKARAETEPTEEPADA